MEEGQHTSAEDKIGQVLERARKEKGLSLEEAERATKIRKRYLEGLENDDYTVLPDAVYARGFLKTYANFLGLDGDGLSRELKTRRRPRRERGLDYQAPGEVGRPIISPGDASGSKPRARGVQGERTVSRSTVIAVAVAVVVIAALVGALYFVGLNARSVVVEEARETARRTPAEVTPREDASPETLTVGVEVEGAPAWLRVSSDSETVFEEIAPPGFSRTFEARRVVGIRAGDAGAVSIEVNGQDVGTLGEPGQVGDQSFTLKSAS